MELLGPGAETPLEVEVALPDSGPDSMLEAEIEEFRDVLEEAEGDPASIAQVREHLANTRAIVAIRLPASQGGRASEAARVVLSYYGQRSGVLFQMDADGFYDSDRRIVAVG